MVGQFADLREMVDGTNTYEVLLAVAAGEPPALRRAAGRFPVAASFPLRAFEDRRVLRVPDAARLAEVRRRRPVSVVKVYCRPGHWLSEEGQSDGLTHRYGVVNMGGRSRSRCWRSSPRWRVSWGSPSRAGRQPPPPRPRACPSAARSSPSTCWYARSTWSSRARGAVELAGAPAQLQLLAPLGEGQRAELRAVGLEAVRHQADGVCVARVQGRAELAQQLGGIFQERLDQLGQELRVAAAQRLEGGRDGRRVGGAVRGAGGAAGGPRAAGSRCAPPPRRARGRRSGPGGGSAC